MNSKVVEKQKVKAKRKSSLTQSELDRYGSRYCSVSENLSKHGPEDCISTILSPAHYPMQIWITLSTFIHQLSDVRGKVTVDGYFPEIHMKRK